VLEPGKPCYDAFEIHPISILDFLDAVNNRVNLTELYKEMVKTKLGKDLA
jgi:hypothetical protein